MSEKEKMLSGALYYANDPELIKERIECKILCSNFNKTDFLQLEERKILLKKILGKVGKNFHIEQTFQCDYGYNIEIGDNFYSNHNLLILDCAKVTFGDNVLVGPNCSFYTPEHPFDVKTRNAALEYAREIKVGSNVWFGGNVVVLSGVNIGDNSIIGAGSVVVKDVPKNTVVAGNPAKVIKILNEN